MGLPNYYQKYSKKLNKYIREIRKIAKTNIINSKSFKEMLDDSIRRYHNKIITAAEVIELSKQMTSLNTEAKYMGLSDYEYGFYSDVADNNSAKELMQKEKLRELVVELTRIIQSNVTIDWTIKENVKEKLNVVVKRLLRKMAVH